MLQDDHEEIRGPESARWGPQTVTAFHSFVSRLKAHDVQQLNRHFRTQLDVCANGLATYEYFLPIEDMAQWFPCWEEGLGLQKFTAQGWATRDKAKTWLGGNSSMQTLCAPLPLYMSLVCYSCLLQCCEHAVHT